MNEEEKEAIDYFKECILKDTVYEEDLTINFMKKAVNLIKKQQAEIEILKRDFEIVDHECSRLEQEDIKKDKIINLMAKDIKEADKFLDSMGYLGEYAGYTIDDIIEEYKKEAEYKIKEDK